MKIIKLMADYECWPLWEASGEVVGNIDPSSLPLSAETKKRLENWAQNFDETLNWENPSLSGFADRLSEEKFRREGGVLLDRLRMELGQEYTVLAGFGNMI